MRVLITGVAGFIGSSLAKTLLEDNIDVVGIDCFTDYYKRDIKERNLEELQKYNGFWFINKDILDFNFNCEILKDIDIVYHLAAQAGVRKSWGNDFSIYTRNNIDATQKMLETFKDRNIKKFVFASSSSIYGDYQEVPTSEFCTPSPLSPYGVTKLCGEHLCKLYLINYNVPTISLRFHTVYGPKQRPDMAFHKMFISLIKKQEFIVYGDGTQTRDFTYIDDVVSAIINSSLCPNIGISINIGSGQSYKLNEVINIINQIVKSKLKVKYIQCEKGDVNDTLANIELAKKILNYQNRTNLYNGLEYEYQWILKNTDILI